MTDRWLDIAKMLLDEAPGIGPGEPGVVDDQAFAPIIAEALRNAYDEGYGDSRTDAEMEE